jgi:endonuclease G
MRRSESTQINTYILSNMAPQHKKFNQVIWKRLEGYVRDWARTKDVVYVVTGAIFDEDGDDKRDADSDAARMTSNNGNTRVAIPTHFFKIIMHERPNGYIESLALVLPHNNDRHVGLEAHAYLTSRLTTIAAIEELTGVNFFRDLPNAKETAVEQFQATQLWERN